jgi:hypothetical protein
LVLRYRGCLSGLPAAEELVEVELLPARLVA